MTLRNFISVITLSIILSFSIINGALANSYTSEIFNSIGECNSQKDKNDKLYTNFYRSDCVESKNGDFYYNICDTNYCVASSDASKLIENKEKEVYQYDNSSMTVASSDYKIDDATSEKLKSLAEGLESRFQKMSEADLEKWNENFASVVEKLAEKSINNEKNLALIDGIQKQIAIVIKKQQEENDLCKNQYGIGWKEASFFFESDNMITWIEGNKKHTLACEYNEPKIDKYVAPAIINKLPRIDNAIVENKPAPINPIDNLQGQYGESCMDWLDRIGKKTDNISAKLLYNTSVATERTIKDRCAYMIWKSNLEKYSCSTTSKTYIDQFSPNNPSYPVASCQQNSYTAQTLINNEIVSLENSQNHINTEIKEIDITQPIQDLYRATKNQYADTQTSRYTGIDVCVKEFGVAWQESKEKNVDAYIMLYNKYLIETSGYTQYWDGKKLITTPKDKLLHKACVKNTLDTIVDGKYRITQGKYRGNILREGDICKGEYGNDWKVSKEKIAYTNSFAEHSKTYPNLLAWVLYPNDGDNDCGGHHSNNSWNGTVHKIDNTNRQVNSCSYNIEKKLESKKNNQHFVCEKEKNTTIDITPVVQGLYKTTVNQYSYKEAYGSDFDYCKVEYGRDWKRNIESIDANLMLYSKYKVYTWIEGGKVWNGQKSVSSIVNSTNNIACVEDIYNNVNENYKDILTSATPKEIEQYMQSLEKEILSKIRITNDFVFIDDGFAITQKKYYGNQIYTNKSVCPIGYELQKNRMIGSPKIRYNPYYATILGKYVEKNLDKYYPQEAKSDKITIPFRTWDKWNEQTVNKMSLEDIKTISQKEKFEVYNVNLGNPSRFMKNSYGVVIDNNYFYHGDGSGNGSVEGPNETIGTLLPALCVNTSLDLNSSSSSNIKIKSFEKLELSEEKLMINGKSDQGRGHIFFAYGHAKVTGFFNYQNYAGVKYVEYFLPKNTGNTLWFIKKKHR